MIFAYADPPYYKTAKKFYGDLHPDAAEYDKEETHIQLVERLMDEYPDGWALSCNPSDLKMYLPHCDESVRVAAWVKTFHQIRPTTVQYAWEPVLFRGGRKNNKRKPMVRDWLSCARSMKKGLVGSKPDLFNDWILDLLNYDTNEDEIHDLFPGTHGMDDAVKRKVCKNDEI